jgi:arylsulfatase A-like enzyme
MKQLTLLLLLFACACWERTPRPTPTPTVAPTGVGMNVLLITIDTLRADHLGMYGYDRRTSPRMDAIAAEGTVFDNAYTYWPKTRGSFAAIMSGKPAARSGYEQKRRMLHDFNVTLASALQKAQFATAAFIDNPNVGAAVGFAQGFDRFVETWEDKTLATEADRARVITANAVRFLKDAPKQRPFFLWLHYVSPHGPYTPPPPYDTLFLDERAKGGKRLAKVDGFFGGIPARWAVPGQDRLGYYVAQYDGEIAAVDEEVGKVVGALRVAGLKTRTLVMLTSDHGESLGEHDYYFDHGADLFDPCLRIPLVIVDPGGRAKHRTRAQASTLDIFPTILDAAKVSYPPDLEGMSLMPALSDQPIGRERLFAENDRGHKGTHDPRFKLVSRPGAKSSLYDRASDPGETRDIARSKPADFQTAQRELSRYLERSEREWIHTRPLIESQPTPQPASDKSCQMLKALGYVDSCPGDR